MKAMGLHSFTSGLSLSHSTVLKTKRSEVNRTLAFSGRLSDGKSADEARKFSVVEILPLHAFCIGSSHTEPAPLAPRFSPCSLKQVPSTYC